MDSLLPPFLIFCAVSFLTPGPNNLMLMTSGLNYGLRRTLPHILGVDLGFTFLALCVGLGLGAVFTRYPLFQTLLSYGGAAYILYLAWGIARAPLPHDEKDSGRKPMSFLQAVAFQWINPKAWIMALGGISTYAALASYPHNILLICGIFLVFGALSSFAWAGLGFALQKFLHRPRLVRAFNVAMALLLGISVYPVLADLWR